MSKVTITEDKLTSLIEESVYELLQEAETDERLGHFLGDALQSIKNGWNRFKGDINAGRNYARYRDRGNDSYDKYGPEANNFRNFGGREYADYRYNQAVDRNRNSANQWNNEFGTSTNSWHDRPNQGTQQNTPAGNQNAQSNANGNNTGAVSNTTPTPNPNTTAQNTATQNATAQNTSQQNTGQTNGGKKQFTQAQKDANKANTLNQLKQQRNNAALFLQQKGFTKRGGQWIYAKDGSNSPAAESQYPDIRNANSRYEYYNNKMNMMERKLKLNNIISESVDKVLRSYNKKTKK